jgi:hypothetical protein
MIQPPHSHRTIAALLNATTTSTDDDGIMHPVLLVVGAIVLVEKGGMTRLT